MEDKYNLFPELTQYFPKTVSRFIANIGKAEFGRLEVIQPIVATERLVTSPLPLGVGR
jgi:hypothetical protein